MKLQKSDSCFNIGVEVYIQHLYLLHTAWTRKNVLLFDLILFFYTFIKGPPGPPGPPGPDFYQVGKQKIHISIKLCCFSFFGVNISPCIFINNVCIFRDNKSILKYWHSSINTFIDTQVFVVFQFTNSIDY